MSSTLASKASEHSLNTAGIFNVNKPAGMTSHQVVNMVRRAAGHKRVGHAGTLDPLATGVLVICLGWATRLSEYLMAGRKHYRAVVHLGMSTTTYDREGEATAVADASGLTLQQVNEAAAMFRGTIEQRPPIYAALKHKGKPLYRLARQGRTVERAPRTVHIYELSVVDWSPPLVTLDVVCSKGTYIRSLAHDLGEKLGCGAHLAALTRLASGPFRLEQAVSPEELAAALREGRAAALAYPVTQALADFGTLTLDGAPAEQLRHGQAIPGPGPQPRSPAIALLPSGEPIAIVRYDQPAGRWLPVKVLV